MVDDPDGSLLNLRYDVYDCMRKWGIGHCFPYSRHLKWLLRGEEASFYEGEDMSEPEVAACKALCGPHGFSIYKTLLVQRRGE
jgi:hypothetical protein